MRKLLAAIVMSLTPATGALAAGEGVGDIPPPIIECGGTFQSFVGRMKELAVSKGHDQATVDQFFASVAQDGRTLGADGAQGIFTSGFIDFSRKLISQNRVSVGQQKLQQIRNSPLEAELAKARRELEALRKQATDPAVGGAVADPTLGAGSALKGILDSLFGMQSSVSIPQLATSAGTFSSLAPLIFNGPQNNMTKGEEAIVAELKTLNTKVDDGGLDP